MFVCVPVRAMMMVVVHAHCFPLALKQPRFQTVLCALPEFQQRGGLCHIVDGELAATFENRLRLRNEPMLQRLRLQWTNQDQSTRAAGKTPQVNKEKKLCCIRTIQS